MAPTGRANCRTRPATPEAWSRRCGSSIGVGNPVASPNRPPHRSSPRTATRCSSCGAAGCGRSGWRRMPNRSNSSAAAARSGTCASPPAATGWRSCPPAAPIPSWGSMTSARRPSTISTRRWTATAHPPSHPTGAKWRSCARRPYSSGSSSFRAGKARPGASGWLPWTTRVPAGRCSARSPEREACSPAPPPPTSSTGRMTAASSFPGSAPVTGTTTPCRPRAASRKH